VVVSRLKEYSMTQIKMAPEGDKPANPPSPSEKDKQSGAKPDEITSPTEVKRP
jgi:hypothetical protein